MCPGTGFKAKPGCHIASPDPVECGRIALVGSVREHGGKRFGLPRRGGPKRTPPPRGTEAFVGVARVPVGSHCWHLECDLTRRMCAVQENGDSHPVRQVDQAPHWKNDG